jgi:hypothetical protein
VKTLFLVWSVIIVAGLTAMTVEPAFSPIPTTLCEYSAKRYTPTGFRLRDGDWTNPDSAAASISGKYTDRRYEKDQPICAGNLRAAPPIEPRELSPIVLTVPAGPLNAGAIVDVYRSKKLVVGNVPVFAILCGDKDCPYVVVGLKEKDIPAVTDGDAVPVLLVRQLP